MPRSLLVLALLVALPAEAQITYTRADFEAGFDRLDLTSVYDPQSEIAELAAMPDTTGLMAILRADGPSQTWDLTTLVSSFALFDQREIVPIPDDPNLDDFPGFDHPHFLETGTNVAFRIGVRRDVDESPDSVTTTYLRLDDTGSYLTGSVGADLDTNGDGAADTLVLRSYNPGPGPSGALQFPFPYTFGATYTRMRVDSSAIPLPNPPGGVFEQENLREVTTITVDGWGTLITPNGSFPALRNRIVQNTDVFPPGPSPGDLNLRGYSFVTQGAEAVTLLWIDDFPQDDPSAVVDVFSHHRSAAPVAAEPGVQPGAARLGSPYPNPVVAATRVPFELAAPGPVRLVVYDVLGRSVATLADGARAAGSHEAVFDAAGLPNGVYLVRLDAAGHTATRKVLLQR